METDSSQRKPCRRCLLSETDRDGAYRTVLEYIASLDESVKCSRDEYNSRLSVCKSCEHLADGMCALCGCFVEVRAIKSNQICPDLPRRW